MKRKTKLYTILFYCCFLLITTGNRLFAQTYPAQTPLTFTPLPAISKPVYLGSFVHPNFGTTVTRIGDASVFPTTTRSHHSYAKDQPWNSNGTLIKMHPYIDFALIDAVTLQFVRTIPAVSGSNVWSNTDPNLMYGTSLTSNPNHPAHNAFYKENATTGVITVIRTFTQYTEVNLGSYEGNMSNDDRYAVFQCKKATGGNEIMVYDLVNDVIVATLSIGTIWPNNCCMSQSGNYVVVEWASNGTTSTTGTSVYTRNLTFIRNVNFSAGTHFDVGYDTGGNEVVVQQSTANDRSVTATRIDNGAITTVLTREEMAFPLHISCRNLNRPGWAYISSFQASGTITTAPYYQQVFAVKLDGSRQVNSFAHEHHSTSTDYEHSAFGVPNRNGTFVMWRSDWGARTGAVDSYIAGMSQSGVSGDTQAPTAPTNLSSSNIGLTSFTLSWNASTDNVGVTGYDVYRNGVFFGSTTTATSLSITGLTASTTYSMTVKAKDAAGNVSAASTALSITTSAPSSDVTPPSVPTGLSSSAITSTSFTLSWTASTDNVGVTGYDVFSNGVFFGSTTTATSLSITGLTASTNYSMTVKAKDAAGNISASSTAHSVTTSGTSSNIALNKPVTVSSTLGGSYLASYAVDGNVATSWKSGGVGTQWLYVDLGSSVSISSVVLNWGSPYGKSFTIEVSGDAVNWTNIFSTTTGTGATQTVSASQICRYVRVYATVCSAKNGGYNIEELEVYGVPASSLAAMKNSTSVATPEVKTANVKVSVYPNPVRSKLNVTAPDNINEILIFNQAGQTVHRLKVSGNTKQIDVSSLKAGLYIINVTGNIIKYTGNFIKE